MKLNITREEFIELYNTKSRVDISKQLNISNYMVDQIAQRLGLPSKRGRKLKYVDK